MEPTNGLRPLNDLYQGGGCFFCDQNNPIGPRLRFFEAERPGAGDRLPHRAQQAIRGPGAASCMAAS